MSATINDGGPAFPNVPDGAGDKWSDCDKGLSLRDYFAAQAMQGFLSRSDGQWSLDSVTENAYRVADAMLDRRTT